MRSSHYAGSCIPPSLDLGQAEVHVGVELVVRRVVEELLFGELPSAQPASAEPRPTDDRALLEWGLKEARGNKSKAAKLIGISRKTVTRWIQRFQSR